jgi:hypothetical protein
VAATAALVIDYLKNPFLRHGSPLIMLKYWVKFFSPGLGFGGI